MKTSYRLTRDASLFWGLLTQVTSSLANVALMILSGRLLGPSGLGAVSLSFAGYILVLGLNRALIAEPLAAASGGLGSDQRRASVRSALTLSLGMGGLASLLFAGVGFASGSGIGRSLLIVAPWLIPAMVRDLGRTVLFMENRPRAAAATELAWLLGMAVSAPLPLELRSEWALVAWWGMGALASAFWGFLRLDASPVRISLAWKLFRTRLVRLGSWLAAGSVVSNASVAATSYLIAVSLGIEALGGFRAAQTLFAPLTLVAPAISLPVLPKLSGVIAADNLRAMRLAFSVSALAVTVTVLYLLAILMSGGLMSLVFGPSFLTYSAMLLPFGVGQVALSLGLGPTLLLKAGSRGRGLVVGWSVSALLSLLLIVPAARIYGIIGAAWAVTIGACFATLVHGVIALSVARPGWMSNRALGGSQ